VDDDFTRRFIAHPGSLKRCPRKPRLATCRSAPPRFQVAPNLLDLLERRAQLLGDLLRDHVRVGQGVGIEQPLVFQPEQVERALVLGYEVLVGEVPPAAVRVLLRPGRPPPLPARRLEAGREVVDE
jgi:hypothetical protein